MNEIIEDEYWSEDAAGRMRYNLKVLEDNSIHRNQPDVVVQTVMQFKADLRLWLSRLEDHIQFEDMDYVEQHKNKLYAILGIGDDVDCV